MNSSRIKMQFGSVLVSAFCSLAATSAQAPGAEALYHERYRPQYHFSPPQHWMNDPNGMVYVDGRYHLFYQNYPRGDVWGPMHWGHTVSEDLLRWHNLPLALEPDSLGMIFSGSAVVDRSNSSGFGSLANPPLVAIYTNHDDALKQRGSRVFENQSVAYSLDAGTTWQKYGDNPVLRNTGEKDFRDPKVFWHDGTQCWVMVLAAGDHVEFFSSPDLIHWTHQGDFGRGLLPGQSVWECPDLFALPIQDTGTQKYVLLFSVNSTDPGDNGGVHYLIGEFDGHRFSADPEYRTGTARVDYGADDYAGVTWSGISPEQGRRVFLGWMNNWQYAERTPTAPWRGSMTLPRELTLARDAQGLLLRSMPVAEAALLRSQELPIAAQQGQGPFSLLQHLVKSGLLEIDLQVDCAAASLVTMTLANARGEKLLFRIDRARHRYELDRSHSGAVDFSPLFGRIQYAPMRTDDRSVSLRLFLDASSIEIFVNQGETVMTSLIFPSDPLNTATLTADAVIKVRSGMGYELHSVWKVSPTRAVNSAVHR